MCLPLVHVHREEGIGVRGVPQLSVPAGAGLHQAVRLPHEEAVGAATVRNKN